MNPTIDRPITTSSLAGIIVLVALLVSACASGTPGSASPSDGTPIPATASPTPSTGVSVPATPSPGASASAPADPAADLKIAQPYTLTTLDPNVEASVRQSFMASAGAFGGLIDFGGRAVVSGGKPAGYVFVIGFPPGVMSEITYQSVLSGLASSANLTFTSTTVAGKSLSTGSNAQVGYGVFQAGDAIDMVVTPPGAPADPIARALIAANP